MMASLATNNWIRVICPYQPQLATNLSEMLGDVSTFFIGKNAFEKVVCEMEAILSLL